VVGKLVGASLARIDTKDETTTYVPCRAEQQPYQRGMVDKTHGGLDQPVGRADR